MDTTDSVIRATRRWTLSWVGLALALGLHAADEVANDFLSFWNPLVASIRECLPIVPLPTLTFKLWLGGLVIGVSVLLLLTWFVRKGASWMRPLSYVLGVMMMGNGMFHISATIYLGRAVPGVYSSPVLLIAGGLLLVNALRHRSARRPAVGE